MATDVQLASDPVLAFAQLTAADGGNRAAPNNVVSFGAISGVTANKGYHVRGLRVAALGTTTAGAIRLYRKDGANYRFLGVELEVPARTPQISGPFIAPWYGIWIPDEGYIWCPDAYELVVSTHNAETFNCWLHGWKY